MGSGSSITLDPQNDEEIAKKCAELYKSDPERFQKILTQATSDGITPSSKEGPSSGADESKEPPPVSAGSSSLLKKSENLPEDLIQLFNTARSDPLAVIPILEEHRSRFDGTLLRRPGKVNLRTREGAAAVDDAIADLKRRGDEIKAGKRLPNMALRDGLCNAAKDQADALKDGNGQPNQKDGMDMKSRIERYGDWSDMIGENMDFSSETPGEILCSMLADDGSASRGHRLNIFNEKFKCVGIYQTVHATYGFLTVVDFSGDYGPKKKKLEEAKMVVADGEMTDDVREILDSTPVTKLVEEVEKALVEKKAQVTLDYKPGSLEVVILDGALERTYKGTW